MLSAAAVVMCALELLGRTALRVPPVRFLPAPPAGVSRNAEAFVVHNPDTIYLITSSAVFRDAMRGDAMCGNLDAFRKIASIIAHEEWHLKNGPNEQGAYYAQLTTLGALGASGNVVSSVKSSMLVAVAAQKRRHPELLIAKR